MAGCWCWVNRKKENTMLKEWLWLKEAEMGKMREKQLGAEESKSGCQKNQTSVRKGVMNGVDGWIQRIRELLTQAKQQKHCWWSHVTNTSTVAEFRAQLFQTFLSRVRKTCNYNRNYRSSRTMSTHFNKWNSKGGVNTTLDVILWRSSPTIPARTTASHPILHQERNHLIIKSFMLTKLLKLHYSNFLILKHASLSYATY